MSLQVLKIRTKALAAEAKNIREAEKKAIYFGRICLKSSKLHNKKHNKGESKTEAPVFRVPENPKILAEEVYSRYQNLRHRRTHELRKEARAVHLAYNFLRGNVEYKDVEEFCYELPDLDRVQRIIFFNVDTSKEDELLAYTQRWEYWRQVALGVENEPVRRKTK